MKTVVIALGANLDKPLQQIQAALKKITDDKKIVIQKTSSFYRTKPVGYVNQPDFINAVFIGETKLSPMELLDYLHEIENLFGRVRTFTNAPRTLDLDVIDYHGIVQQTPELTLPHPRAVERAFVMVPMAEITPHCMIHGKTSQEWADSLNQDGIIKIQNTKNQQ